MDLLVSYSWSHFSRVKPEVIAILKRFGDPEPRVEKTATMGIAVVHSCLDNRQVIARCRTLWESDPLGTFRFAIKWVPVDYWCDTALPAMKQVIDSHARERIEQHRSWAMKVHKRRWQRYHTSEIIEYLAADIDRRVDLTHPGVLVWVDIVGPQTAISLLEPRAIFSLGLPYP